MSLACLLLGAALAAPEAPPAPPESFTYTSVQEIDFELRELHATLIGPAVGVVTEPRRLTFAPMIQIRRNFDDTMRASVQEVRRPEISSRGSLRLLDRLVGTSPGIHCLLSLTGT